MRVRLLGDEQAAGAEVVDDLVVDVLHEPALPARDPVVEGAVGPDRVQHGEALRPADGGVVLAEGRGEVDEARAVVRGDEARRDDPLTVALQGQDVEGAAVAPADELAPEPCLARRQLRPPSGRGRLGHDQVAPAIGCRHPHVADVGADRDGDVGEQRPRRRRPDEEVDVAVDDGEADEDRRVDDVAVRVGLAQLVRGQRGAAAGAVGRDPVALVEQARLPHLPEQPPDRLDVVVVHRPVGVVRVDPDAGPLGQRRPSRRRTA